MLRKLLAVVLFMILISFTGGCYLAEHWNDSSSSKSSSLSSLGSSSSFFILSSGSSSSSSSSSSAGSVTLYISGVDHNGYTCVWTVAISGNTTNITETILQSTTGSGTGYMSLKNDTLYIGGYDGLLNGVYWTMKTNGTSINKNVVCSTSQYGANLNWIGFDPSGNLWYTGSESDISAYYWENGTATAMPTYYSGEWATAGNMVFSGGNYYTLWGGNYAGTLIINGTAVAFPTSIGYFGGIAVNNGIIYIDSMDTTGLNYTVWISSNNGVSYSSKVLGMGMDGYSIPFYSGSYLYVPGATTYPSGTPCYWKIDGGSGSATQITLGSKNPYGYVNFIIVTNNMVYAAGQDQQVSGSSQQTVCWINGIEIVLDSTLSANQGNNTIVVTY